MLQMQEKSGKIQSILLIYWILLIYIVSALIWWFIALSNQNQKLANQKTDMLRYEQVTDQRMYEAVRREAARKNAQYIGEGSIFLLLIMAGAIFLFRAVKNQLRNSRQQQHFMMAVTHELKTPIAVTRLNLETMQKHKLEEAQMHKLIGNTLQEAGRMNDLCNNLLLSSQMEGGAYKITLEEKEISALMGKSVQDFKTRFPERTIQLEARNECVVDCDIFLIQMAVNNLLDNALKYTRKDIPITVSIECDSEFCNIRIADKGPGIAKADREKIFQKFYRAGSEATQRSKGTGLGLYLVKRIINAHRGEVFLEERPETGASFCIRLKRVTDEQSLT